MKQTTALEKIAGNRLLTDTAITMKIKDLLYPLMMHLTGIKVKYHIERLNDMAALPDKPIIFAVNHSAFQDTPIVLRETGKRSYVLSGKQKLSFVDWLFFEVNGVVWVDRGAKQDMAAAKCALCEYLKKGRSVLWFPEGTWNLDPCALMLPMKWGIIEVCKTSDAQIIPIALEYDRKKMFAG